MSAVKIFHNPACGTSRNTLALIQNAGIEYEVILYLQHPLLINRPFVITELGTRLTRPSKVVLDIFSSP